MPNAIDDDLLARLPEIFTPARPVRTDMFATRRHNRIEERVADALIEPGRQLIVYGDTGVGKTSLVDYVLTTNNVRFIRVECSPSFDSMMIDALVEAGIDHSTIESVSKRSTRVGLKATLAGLFAGESQLFSEAEVRRRPLEMSPESAFVAAMEAQGVGVVFFDNFENAAAHVEGQPAVRKMARLLKAVSDSGLVKIVVAGIPHDAGELLRLDDATARRCTQIRVARMPEDELLAILASGEEKLGIEITESAKRRIVRLSDGFPYFVHAIALASCRGAVRRGDTVTRKQHVDDALAAMIDEADLDVAQEYARAVETRGEKRLAEAVLRAIAACEKEEVALRDFTPLFIQIKPEYAAQAKNLSPVVGGALNRLVDQSRVLRTRGAKGTVLRRYWFRNPLLKTYVRILNEMDPH